MTHIAHLPTRKIIALSGADAQSLLQGIITQDVTLLHEIPLLFASLLSPQGKFLFDFFLSKHNDTILIDLDATYQEGFIKTLKRYRLRSDVIIQPLDNAHSYACWDTHSIDKSRWQPDPRLNELGYRATLLNESCAPETNASDTDYNLHRLTLSVPDGTKDATERSFVMELGYDQLHAISFTKGCYVGQEVTARMHYRKSLKKCLFAIQSTDGNALPDLGIPISQNGQEIGEMRSSHGHIGLALVKWADFTANATHKAGNTAVKLHSPAYMDSKLAEISKNEAV